MYDPSNPDKKNVGRQQQADFLEDLSKKLEDDLKEAGMKITHHEDNLQHLETLKTKLDESILKKQASLESYDKAHAFNTMDGDSAATLWFRLKRQAENMSSDQSFTNDVIGVVATLGKVDDENLSRLLSKYLGLETMLVVVCKTNEGLKTLEVIATSTEMSLSNRFSIICLEHIRPYAGECMDDDPQRKLSLLKPRLPSTGETPPGFLDFAVNMINIDTNYLHYNSKNCHNLRETLFYHLFSKLQVYRSREDMLRARSCISTGAISLDGGMARSPAVCTLGLNRQDIDVKFPIGCERLNLPESSLKGWLKETKWKRDQTIQDMQMEMKLLDLAKSRFKIKKKAVLQFLDENS